MFDKDSLLKWAKEKIKPKHKIEKSDPLREAIIAVCDVARDYGDMPDWLIESTIISAAKNYYRS